MSRSKNPTAVPVPHSWAIESWPAAVYPNTAERARYVVRAHRRALLDAGALVRIGRALVIVGAAYDRWLNSHGANVESFSIAANRGAADQHAAGG